MYGRITSLIEILCLLFVSVTLACAEEPRLSGRFVVFGPGPMQDTLAKQQLTKIWRGATIDVMFEIPGPNAGVEVVDASELNCVVLRVYAVDETNEVPVDILFRPAWPMDALPYRSFLEPRWRVLCDLKPGRYVLRATLPHDSGVQVGDKGKFAFEIVEPETQNDRYTARCSVISTLADMGELVEAEARAFKLVSDFPAHPWAFGYYAFGRIYLQAGLRERAFEFSKEYLRRNYRRIINADGSFSELFTQMAVSAGAVASKAEGDKLYHEFVKKLQNGEDTGKLSQELLHPVLGKQLQAPTEDSPAQPPTTKE